MFQPIIIAEIISIAAYARCELCLAQELVLTVAALLKCCHDQFDPIRYSSPVRLSDGIECASSSAEDLNMKLINVVALLSLGVAAFAQEVQYDYDRSANFNSYKTYQWVDTDSIQVDEQLLDKNIKRAVDAQLAGKGLRRVESGGDLLIGYQTAISKEKQFDGLPSGPPWWGAWAIPGSRLRLSKSASW